MEGIIFNIKKFAIHDGPGIRTSIFFKGCSLKCRWCHNPESINKNIEKYISTDKISDKIFKTEKNIGYKIGVKDLYKEILKEKIFMEESNGGVTLTGGEPLLQSHFAAQLLQFCKKDDIHTAIDTAGNVPYDNFKTILPYTDLFLYDIKFFNAVKHKKYTGANNKLILNNFINIIKTNKKIIVRIPLIPHINLNITEMKEIRDFLLPHKGNNFEKIELLPYHHTGQSKYTRFNIENKMKGINEPKINEITPIKELFESAGFIVKLNS